MSTATFERDFVAALFASAADDRTAPDYSAQPGFAVYRNTVRKGGIDALEANFPAVLQLVGTAWFRAVAAEHVLRCPPRDPCLLRYGEDFPADLAAHAPEDLPYLHGVALLDRLWTAAHTAADAPVLPADALAGLPPDALAGVRLRPHPATRWHWFDGLPVQSLWSANRSGDAAALDALADLAWVGEGTLLVRPQAAVRWQALSIAGCALLDACARGDALGDAALAVLTAHPDADLAALLASLLRAGAFTSLERPLP